MKTTNERKNEIFAKSIELMHLNGYNATGIKEIADALGLSKSTFYSYFKSKEEYTIELIAYYRQHVSPYKTVLYDKNLPPLERIKELFAILYTRAKNINALQKGCLVGNLSEELGGVNENIAKEANAMLLDIEKAICNNLKEARANGNFNHVMSDEALAVVLNSFVQGVLLRTKVANDIGVIEKAIQFIDELLR